MSAIVLDACTIISFANAGHLDLIVDLRLHRVCVSARARGEVLRDPGRAAMEASIAAGKLSVEQIDIENPAEQEALRDFDARAAFRGRGDAEVLALAVCRGYIVASDERAIRSVVVDLLGAERIASTADFIVWGVQESRIRVAEAEDALAQLDSGPAVLARLERSGRTVDDLVRGVNHQIR